MKKLIFILILLVTIPSIPQQQDKFIIGAEHVSAMGRFGGYGGVPHSNAYWDSVKTFGLNWAGLKYFQTYGSFGSVTPDNIRADITLAEGKDIKVFIYNGFDRYANGEHYYPKRWVYQVENVPGNNFNDFLYVPNGSNADHSYATTHWNFAPPPPQTPNFLHLDQNSHPYGLVANDLREQNLQPDSLNYYLKIRMRLPDATSYPDVGVLDVRVKKAGGSTLVTTILASEFVTAGNDWKEIYVRCFYKAANGPQVCIPDAPDSLVYDYTDTIGINQVPNNILKEGVASTAYDIEIEWLDTPQGSPDFTVDLDYLAVDDYNAHLLFYDHYFDARIQNFATEYKNEADVLNFQAWDEPFRANLFPVSKIQAILYDAGVGDKEPLCYRAFFDEPVPNKRFLYETNMQVLLSNIYPIPYFHYATATPYVKPGEPNYTDSIQARLQSHLVSPLSGLINEARKFEKPFWFTVQAHKWAVLPAPDDPDYEGQMWHREPSAYEIKAMVNLAVCYGAKGIIYYLYAHNYDDRGEIVGFYYHDDPDWDGSKRVVDEYGYPKWETVKQLNQKLTSIGDELISLVWQNEVWSIRQGQPTSGYITNIQAYYNSTPDIPDETYIELSESKKINEETNDNLEYFFIVNRHTLQGESRDIKVVVDKSTTNPDNWQNWVVKEIGTSNSWNIGEVGDFETSYDEGEGKLFRLAPVVMDGGSLIYDEVINDEITLKEDLVIESGVTLTVNANYHCYGNITLNGGNIFGGGKIFFHDNKRIIVEGTSQILGSSGTIELDFIAPIKNHYQEFFLKAVMVK